MLNSLQSKDFVVGRFLSGAASFSLATKLKVLPVMDILNGQVVHAIRGERSQYKPIESILTKSAEPLKVAETFKAEGFTEVYVADVDAIVDCTRHDFEIVKQISEKTWLKLWVDAGVTSLMRARKLLEAGASKIVIGTETLQSKTFVKEALEKFGADHIILSLDLKNRKTILKPEFDGCPDPVCLLKEFATIGVKQVIVLDLARVGSCEGADVDFLKKAKSEVGVDVVAGGGIRNIWDLMELQDKGISGALVATSLHTGKIKVAELKAGGFL